MINSFLSLVLVLSSVNINYWRMHKSDEFVKIEPKLWVAKYEVTNADYAKFLRDLQLKSGNEEVQKWKPDSILWNTKLSTAQNQPMFEKYHNHPAYLKYPVVNISMEAALKYCDWLTESYHKQKKREFKKVVFRLPTEEEWQSFSAPLVGNRLPWYGNLPYLSDENGQIECMLANIKMMDYASGNYNSTADGGWFTTKAGVYKSNNLGLFDIIGNASEMTSDDKVKGGSWDNTLEECYIDLSQNYSAPDPRVGFRVVMELIETGA